MLPYYRFFFVPYDARMNMPQVPQQQIMPQYYQPTPVYPSEAAPEMMPMNPNMVPQVTAPEMMPGINPNMVPQITAPEMMPDINPNMVPQITAPEMMPMNPNMVPQITAPEMMPGINPNMVPQITAPEMMQNIPPNNWMPQPMSPYSNNGMYDMGMSPATARPGDPPPILSNNPPVTSVTLFKELTGYPNYGNPSRNADILYTGNRGVWTFQLPVAFAALETNFRAQILVRGVLDDHYDVPENRYSATITVNNDRVHTGRVPLNHGRPFGAMFTNWRTLTFDIRDLRRNNRIVIVNTSNTGPNDFIALDWMELRLIPRR
mgnify:CR=1 FL=1